MKGEKREKFFVKWKAKMSKFFERFGLKEEKQLITAGKVLILCLLVFIAALILLQLFTTPTDLWRTLVAGGLLISLIVAEWLNLFVAKKTAVKVFFYIVDLLCIFALTAATASTYLELLYILVLTEFYLSAEKIRASVIVFCIGVPLYLASFTIATFLWKQETASIVALLSQLVEALVLLTVHFVVVNFLLAFYRQYLRLRKALKDLDESNARLQEAYDELAEVTALQERQRIAKDLHDTAGHSITTVIMQTEAAKLIVEQDAHGAKQKIIAANLQAKHALEELRDCVHLLSGSLGKPTLKTALLKIIMESTDGTDVKIRHSVEDVNVCDAKYRLITNALREGVSNGLRHGGATAFYFELKEVDGQIEFLLSDNGRGQEMSKLKEGFGLSGMIKGVQSLGGSVSLYTELNEGFEIRLILPSDEEGEEGGVNEN